MSLQPRFRDELLTWPEIEKAFRDRLSVAADVFYALREAYRELAFTVRQIADKESAKRLEQIGRLSEDLQKRDAALEVANQRAMEYAKELQGFKDFILKIAWVVGAFFLLYFLGQILQFAANINPAFGTASNFVNAVVSPALHSAAWKARKAAVAAAAAVKSPSP
jgi:hypothetical protein